MFKASVIRITDKNYIVRGMGYLVMPDTVITCAHVVSAALENIDSYQSEAPTQCLYLNRPLSGLQGDKETFRKAKVIVWYPTCESGQEPESGLADIAVLKIKDAGYSTDLDLALLAPGPQFDNLEFEAYGCPKGHDYNTVHVSGLTRRTIGNGRIQIEKKEGYPIELGYSGAPVWSEDNHSIIGIIVQKEGCDTIPAGFIIPSTLLLKACPDDVREQYYKDQCCYRDDLVRGIDHNVAGYDNRIKRFLDLYLGNPEQPVPFGGRGATLKSLDLWLKETEQPCRLLTAPAGRGKSALLVHWMLLIAQHHPEIKIIFLPISIRFETNACLPALRCLVARLSLFFPNEKVEHSSTLSVDAYKIIVNRMWQKIKECPDVRFLLVLDGIDEAINEWVNINLLPYEQPKNLKIILSARYKPSHINGEAWLESLEWQHKGKQVLMDLDLLDLQGLSDVLACMGKPLDALIEREALLKELYRLSEQGDPLLVSLYVEKLWKKREHLESISIEYLRALEPGYEGFFKKWYKDQKILWKNTDKSFQREMGDLFSLLASSLAPLSFNNISLLADNLCFKWEEDTLEELLNAASRLIVGNPESQPYSFIHPKLVYYFHDNLNDKEKKRYEQAYINWGQKVLSLLSDEKLAPNKCPEYLLHAYLEHLERSHADIDLYLQLLKCKGWHQAWFILEGSYNGYLSNINKIQLRLKKENINRKNNRQSLLIGEEVRCLLGICSIRTLTDNLPPELIAALVETGLWNSNQALWLIESLDEEHKKAEALLCLIEAFNGNKIYLDKARRIYNSINIKSNHITLMCTLASQLNKINNDDILFRQSIKYIGECILKKVDYYNKDKDIPIYIDIPSYNDIPIYIDIPSYNDMPSYNDLVIYLDIIISSLTANQHDLCRVVFAIASNIPKSHEKNRAELFGSLAAQVFNNKCSLKNDLITDTNNDPNEDETSIYIILLTIDNRISENNRIFSISKLLKNLNTSCSSSLLKKILDIICKVEIENEKSEALSILSQHIKLYPNLISEVLDVTSELKSQDNQLKILNSLANILKKYPKLLNESISIADQMVSEDYRVKSLCVLALPLENQETKRLLQSCLKIVKNTSPYDLKYANILVDFVPNLLYCKELAEDYLNLASKLFYKYERIIISLNLARYLPKNYSDSIIEEALYYVKCNYDESIRGTKQQQYTMDNRYCTPNSVKFQCHDIMALLLNLSVEYPDSLRKTLGIYNGLCELDRKTIALDLIKDNSINDILFDKIFADIVQIETLELKRSHLTESQNILVYKFKLSEIQKISDKQYQIQALKYFIGIAKNNYNYLNTLLVLIDNEDIDTLSKLVPDLKNYPELLEHALAIAKNINDKQGRINIISIISKQFTGQKKQNIIQQVIKDIFYNKPETIKSLKTEVLDLRLKLLCNVGVPLITDPEQFTKLLEDIKTFDKDDHITVLKKIVPRLKGNTELLEKALPTISEYQHDSLLSSSILSLAKKLSDNDKKKIISLAFNNNHGNVYNFCVLTALFTKKKVLPLYFEQDYSQNFLQDYMRTIKKLKGTEVISLIASQLSSESKLLPKLLKLAEDIQHEMSKKIDKERQDNTLRFIYSIIDIDDEDEFRKRFYLKTCRITSGGKRFQQVLEVANNIANETNLGYLMSELTPLLKGKSELLEQALQITKNFQNENERVKVLCELVPQMERETQLLQKTLQLAKDFKHENECAKLMCALAPEMKDDSELLELALNIAENFQHNNFRAKVLCAVAEQFTTIKKQNIIEQLFNNINDIEDEDERANTYCLLIHHINIEPLQLLHLLLETDVFVKEINLARVLCAIAPLLINERKSLDQVLQFVENFKYENERVKVLCELVPQMKGETQLLHQTLQLAKNLQYENKRAKLMSALAPELKDDSELLEQALLIVENFKYENERVKVLCELVPQMKGETQLLHQTLQLAKNFQYENERAKLMSALAPELKDDSELLEQALLIVENFKYENEQAKVLCFLSTQMINEPQLLLKSLEIAERFQYQYELEKVLHAIAFQLKAEPQLSLKKTYTKDFLYRKCSELKDKSFNDGRPELFQALGNFLPFFNILGDEDMILETVNAIIDICEWWP